MSYLKAALNAYANKDYKNALRWFVSHLELQDSRIEKLEARLNDQGSSFVEGFEESGTFTKEQWDALKTKDNGRVNIDGRFRENPIPPDK